MTGDGVVLTVRCSRRKHNLEVLTVVDRDGVLYVEAARVSVGRKRSSWTPGRWQIVPGSGRRCGCACGQSWVIMGDDVARWLAAKYTEVVLPPSRITGIGPVRLGAN